MKKITIVLSMLTIVVFYANGQNEKELKNPDEQIIVNKEYDEDGNLTAFDSTYIHQWSSDTTFNLPENDLFAGNMFPDLEKLLDGFMSDSASHRFDFPDPFFSSPFADEDLLKHFGHTFSDSAFMKNFNFELDSLDNNRDFVLPDMNELQKQMEEHFKHFNFPEPKIDDAITDEQKKEMDMLMKKHQKEIDELQEKWKKIN